MWPVQLDSSCVVLCSLQKILKTRSAENPMGNSLVLTIQIKSSGVLVCLRLDTTPNALVSKHEAFRKGVDLEDTTYSSRLVPL